MDEQSERLIAGPAMAFSPAACMTVSACFGLTMLIQRIESSIETAENNTSDAPERWGLAGISPGGGSLMLPPLRGGHEAALLPPILWATSLERHTSIQSTRTRGRHNRRIGRCKLLP